MQWWQAVVLGIVEGVTEYLPVSSTGHLILASHLLSLKSPSVKDAVDAFDVVIQGGAILAVVGLYWSRFVQMLRGIVGRDPAGLRLLINLFVAFLPAAIVGLLIHKWIKAHLFSPGPVIGALAVGGIYMIVIDLLVIRPRRPIEGALTPGIEIDDLTPRKALTIGGLQILSMWPGTSRSMMTITGGVLVGLRPAAAAEFSFLLGVPTLLAATGLDLFKNILEARKAHTPNLFQELGATSCFIGIAVAAVSAAIAIKWLVSFLNRHGLTPFGVYRILLSAAMTVLIARGLVSISMP